jgi:hypothetical protein
VTKLRIVEESIDTPRGDAFYRDVKPADDLACLLALRDEVHARGLGDWHRYRVEAWDPMTGWIPHRPS